MAGSRGEQKAGVRSQSGHSNEEILRAYPYLAQDDLHEALAHAAWRVEEVEVPLARPLANPRKR